MGAAVGSSVDSGTEIGAAVGSSVGSGGSMGAAVGSSVGSGAGTGAVMGESIGTSAVVDGIMVGTAEGGGVGRTTSLLLPIYTMKSGKYDCQLTLSSGESQLCKINILTALVL